MRYFFILLLLYAYAGCKNSSDKVKESVTDTILYDVPDSVLIWNTDAESKTMKKYGVVPDSLITINGIINGLNEKYPQVKIVFLKQSGDTIYTEVPDATFLGEQMGDAGSSAWFADVVINLTGVPGVNYVSFNMDTHSHAGSGIISREAYKNWKRE